MQIIVHYALCVEHGAKTVTTCFVSLCEHFFILSLLIVTWSLLPKKWLHTTGARMGIPLTLQQNFLTHVVFMRILHC